MVHNAVRFLQFPDKEWKPGATSEVLSFNRQKIGLPGCFVDTPIRPLISKSVVRLRSCRFFQFLELIYVSMLVSDIEGTS